MPFRKALVWIRSLYVEHRKDLFLYGGILAAVLSGITVLADLLLVWDQWAIFVRAGLAIPASATLFTLGYALVMLYVDARAKRNEEYENWRQRLSPLMRQRVSIIIGAILLVLMFAVVQRPGYTLVSSLIIAVAIGLFAFRRKTIQELNREKIGLPDTRDASFDSHIRQRSREAAQRRAERRGKRTKKLSEASQEELEREIKERMELEKKLEK